MCAHTCLWVLPVFSVFPPRPINLPVETMATLSVKVCVKACVCVFIATRGGFCCLLQEFDKIITHILCRQGARVPLGHIPDTVYQQTVVLITGTCYPVARKYP